VNLFNVDTDAGIEIAFYVDPRNDQTEAAKLTEFCLACHDSDGADGDTTPFSTGNTVVNIATGATSRAHTSSSASCFGDGNFGCHGSGHGGQKLAILTPAEFGPGTSPDFTDENETFCLTCHDGGTPVLTPPAPNILADLGGSYAASVNEDEAQGGAWVNQNHDILPADKDVNLANGGIRPKITCANCHLQPHDAVATSPIIKDPDTATVDNPLTTGTAFTGLYSPSNRYQDVWDYSSSTSPYDHDPTSPDDGGTHDKTDYVEFCLTCHDGSPPPGITMSADLVDIATAYNSDDKHGRLPNSTTGSTLNRGGMKAPWTVNGSDVGVNLDPTGAYAALPCTMCHGPHGSGNIFNLRTSINIAGTQMSTGSVSGGGGGFDDIIGTYYELPVQANRQWGAWCTFCHHLSGHSYSETKLCNQGHLHGGGNF